MLVIGGYLWNCRTELRRGARPLVPLQGNGSSLGMRGRRRQQSSRSAVGHGVFTPCFHLGSPQVPKPGLRFRDGLSSWPRGSLQLLLCSGPGAFFQAPPCPGLIISAGVGLGTGI